MSCKKCQFPKGVTIKPDGIHDLDPCKYQRMESHKNVTVHIDRCMVCGHVEISWTPQENTQSIIHAEIPREVDGGLKIQRYFEALEEELDEDELYD
ncbi:MAG: hypothetical protein IKZ08_02430 [Bacteroidales bacterium]|nr:hypothetical protein [Bacteroidales bacterium]